ncbi:MAG TPA: diacylglycerol kinase family protein [Acidimicrobiales bacterium]|jgi:undecaprenyl-diphosphatase
MGTGRFLRRGALRAALAASAARPLGVPASAAAAVTGAGQEHPVLGVGLAVPAAALLARRGTARGPGRLAAGLAGGVAVGVATRFVWPVAPKEPAQVAPVRRWSDVGAIGRDGTGIGIVVNPGAGAGAGGLASMDPATALRGGLPGAEVVEPDDPADLQAELERLATGGCSAIGVAGGDGSINTAAGVALRHGLPLVVVPAGTLNHLARDLGVETVHDAVEAVRQGSAAEIDVGWIAGRPFLNTASLGGYVEVVDAREALESRIGKWPALAVALARVLRHGEPVEVTLDGEPRRLWLVFVGNCRYQPEGMAPTWRERLDDGCLDVRVVDASHPYSRTRLVLAALTGTLRRTQVFETWQATDLHVKSSNGPLRLARDGETFDGDDDFEIAKDGSRLVVFTPHR